MPTFGRTVLGSTGSPVQVAADGHPEWKTGGVTIDWPSVAAVSADTLLPDGITVPNGQKYLRYGQVLCREGVAEVQTVEFTGGPTTGSAIVTLPASSTEPAESSAAISATATAAAFQAALEAMHRVGPGGATVARAGAGTAGSPYVYTVTFNRVMGDVGQLTATNTFGGGTTPTTTIATTTAGTGGQLFGPYDPNATDGRQTLNRGDCFIINQTVLQNGPIPQLGGRATDHPGALAGGRMWKQRILANYTADSLASGPTYAHLEAAMPRMSYAQ